MLPHHLWLAGHHSSSCVFLAAETIAKIRTATKANMAKKAVQDKLRSAALGKSHSEESRVSCALWYRRPCLQVCNALRWATGHQPSRLHCCHECVLVQQVPDLADWRAVYCWAADGARGTMLPKSGLRCDMVQDTHCLGAAP